MQAQNGNWGSTGWSATSDEVKVQVSGDQIVDGLHALPYDCGILIDADNEVVGSFRGSQINWQEIDASQWQ